MQVRQADPEKGDTPSPFTSDGWLKMNIPTGEGSTFYSLDVLLGSREEWRDFHDPDGAKLDWENATWV